MRRIAIFLTSLMALALTREVAASEGQAAGGQAEPDYRSVHAQGKVRYLLDIDNDSLLLKRNDGFYTSGINLVREATATHASGATTYGWRLGQELYTASDSKLRPEQIGRDDHPYAGWLYAGAYRRVVQNDGGSTRIGLDIGCFGPCAGGYWTQTNLHRILNQPLPQGWSSQLKNEAGVVLNGMKSLPRWRFGNWLDASTALHGRFGNIFTDAGGELTLRAGRLNVLPDEPALLAFARLDGRAVAYNATLQGGYFTSGNTRTVTPKRWVGEVEAGVLWQGASYGIKASFVRRSNEIQDLPNSIGAQNFARLQFSYTP